MRYTLKYTPWAHCGTQNTPGNTMEYTTIHTMVACSVAHFTTHTRRVPWYTPGVYHIWYTLHNTHQACTMVHTRRVPYMVHTSQHTPGVYHGTHQACTIYGTHFTTHTRRVFSHAALVSYWSLPPLPSPPLL